MMVKIEAPGSTARTLCRRFVARKESARS